MKQHAIIVAGGSGERMMLESPKQFLLLSGVPVLMHTVKKFASLNGKIIVALPYIHISTWEKLCLAYGFEIPHIVCEGGVTRFHSVKNALKKVQSNNSLVAVHDGVRPVVSEELIRNVFEGAQKNGNAVPFLPLSESIRKIDANGNNSYADRKKFISIQTPQCFSSTLLRKAYERNYNETYTDDATVVEAVTGEKIFLIKGEKQNIKITTLEDMVLAETLLSGSN